MVEVRESLARWLLKEGLIDVGDVNLKARNGVGNGSDEPKSSGVELSPEALSRMQSGIGVLDVLLKVLPQEVAVSYSNMKGALKSMESPIARLFNWNMLVPVLSAAGIDLDVDKKALIVAGDTEAVLLVLTDLVGGKELIAAENGAANGMHYPIINVTKRSHDIVEPLLEEPVNLASPPSVPVAPVKLPTPAALLPPAAVLRRSSVRASLEGVVVEALTDALSITKDEAMRSLLADGCAGLQRLLSGTNAPAGNGREALAALESLMGAVRTMGPWRLPEAYYRGAQAATEKRGGLPTILAAFAHGLGSSLDGVPSRSCVLLEQAVKACESPERLKPVVYDWIASPLRAGPSILLMLQLNRGGARYHKITDSQSESSTGNSIESDIASVELGTNVRALASLLVTLGDEGRMASFLERDLRQLCSGPLWFVEALARLMPSLSRHNEAAGQIRDSVSSVMTMALQMCESEDDKERKAAVDLLTGMWTCFPNTVEENVEVSLCRSTLAMLKRACRDPKESVRLSTYRGLLQLLESFVAAGSEHGTVVYKILIFTIIEHASDYNSRRQLLMGLGAILDRHEGMPVGVFVEPLVKQITRTQSHYADGNRDKPSTSVSELDAEFLHQHIVRHPQLTTVHASLLLQLLATSGTAFAETIAWVTPPLRVLAKRFCMEPGPGRAIERACGDFVSQMDRHISRQEMEACSVLSKFMQSLFPYVLSHSAQRMLKESFAKWNGILKSQNASHSNEVMFEMMAKILEDLPSNHVPPPASTTKRYKHPVDEVLHHRHRVGREEEDEEEGSECLAEPVPPPIPTHAVDPGSGGIRSLHTNRPPSKAPSSTRGASRGGSRADDLPVQRGRVSVTPSVSGNPVRSMSADSRGQRGAPSPATAEHLSKHRRKISYSELSDVSKKERQRKDARLRRERQREIDKIRLKREALKAAKIKEEEAKRREMERREAARRKRNENLLLHKPNVYGPAPIVGQMQQQQHGPKDHQDRQPQQQQQQQQEADKLHQRRGSGAVTTTITTKRDAIEDELILEALNRRLARNPNTVMPPGFERILVKDPPTADAVRERRVQRCDTWTTDAVLEQVDTLRKQLSACAGDAEAVARTVRIVGVTVTPMEQEEEVKGGEDAEAEHALESQASANNDKDDDENPNAIVRSVINGVVSRVFGEDDEEGKAEIPQQKQEDVVVKKIVVTYDVVPDPRLLQSRDELGEEKETELCKYLLGELPSSPGSVLPAGFAVEEVLPAPVERYTAVRKQGYEVSLVHGTPRQPSQPRMSRPSIHASPSTGPGSKHSGGALTVDVRRGGKHSSGDRVVSQKRRSLSAGVPRRARGVLSNGSDDSGGSTPSTRRAIPFAEQAVRKYLRDYAETLLITLADKCDRRRGSVERSAGTHTSGRKAPSSASSSSSSVSTTPRTRARTRSAEPRRSQSHMLPSSSSSASSLSARGPSSSASTPRVRHSSARGPMGVDFSYLRHRREQEKLAIVEERRKQETRRIEQMKRDREHAEAIRLQVAAYREEKRRREDEELQKRRAAEKMKKERARAAAELERQRREEDKKKIKEYYTRVQAEQEEKRRVAEEELRLQEERRREALKEYRRRKAKEQEKENNPALLRGGVAGNLKKSPGGSGVVGANGVRRQPRSTGGYASKKADMTPPPAPQSSQPQQQQQPTLQKQEPEQTPPPPKEEQTISVAAQPETQQETDTAPASEASAPPEPTAVAADAVATAAEPVVQNQGDKGADEASVLSSSEKPEKPVHQEESSAVEPIPPVAESKVEEETANADELPDVTEATATDDSAAADPSPAAVESPPTEDETETKAEPDPVSEEPQPPASAVVDAPEALPSPGEQEEERGSKEAPSS